MTYQMTVSPDFSPERMASWYIFNTWLQRQLNVAIHLELYPGFAEQHQAIDENRVDLIYANPFDAALLVREKGFTAVARPEAKPDEAVIITRAENSIEHIEQLPPGIRIATTAAPDVNLIGMMMLEPANLDAGNVGIQSYDGQMQLVRAVLRGDADIGFMLAEAHDRLSEAVRKQLKVLVTSQISDIHHVLLAGSRCQPWQEQLIQALVHMHDDAKGREVVEGLGLARWAAFSQEEAEFMIDLMDTLQAQP